MTAPKRLVVQRLWRSSLCPTRHRGSRTSKACRRCARPSSGGLCECQARRWPPSLRLERIRTDSGGAAALDQTNPNAYHYLALALNNIKRWDEALQARNAPQRCARPSAPTALASYSACRLQRKPQRSAPRPHNSNTEPNVHRRAHAAQRCSTDGAVRCGAVRCGAVRCGAVRCGAAQTIDAAIARNGRRRNRRDRVGSRSLAGTAVFATCVDEDRMGGLCFPTRRSHRFQER